MAKRRNRNRKKSRRKKRIVILLLEIVILTVLIGAAYVLNKYGMFQVTKIESDDIEVNQGAEKEGYTTIALFGGDSREGELEAGTHADTIIIVSVDNKSKEIRMASIYRDTLLEQMDNTYDKANHAYFNGGPTEAINMLNKNLDLDIEDYVTVDFKAMSDVVDLLGGIEIELTDAEADMLNKYVDETARVAGTTSEHLSGGGVYKLDGPQAVTYARLRKLEGGDYKRTERQRVVIKKLFEKVIHSDLATINDIINTVFPQVSTSFSLSDLIGLASGMTKYKLSDSDGFPFDKTDGITYGNAGSVVVALGLAENVEQLHTFLYPDQENEGVSDTVQLISDNISYLTGVVRPVELDQETEGETEDGTENVPVISGTEGSGE